MAESLPIETIGLWMLFSKAHGSNLRKGDKGTLRKASLALDVKEFGMSPGNSDSISWNQASLAVAQAKVPGQVGPREDTENHQVGCQDPTFEPQVAPDGRPHYQWVGWQ